MSQNYVSISHESRIGKLSVVMQFNFRSFSFQLRGSFFRTLLQLLFYKNLFAEISDFQGGFESFERRLPKQKINISET